MATRRDQLHSYQYLIQRALSAFVMRETDPAQSPWRRGIGAVFGGLMVTILIGAGFGVYGIITKIGGDDWRTDGAVVVERETGASYVFSGGRLHPTLNYASALLAAGNRAPAVSRVAGAALAEVPRGTTIGIAGAPDSLPEPDRILDLPWTICAEPGQDESGSRISTVTLAMARAPHDGRHVRDQGMLVSDIDTGDTYLIWHGHRHPVHEPDTVLPALFGEIANPVPAGTAWLNALPAGADIGPPDLDDLGEPSSEVSDRAVGDLLMAETGSGPQYYLVLDDGLAPVTELQKDILVARFSTSPTTVNIAEATGAPASDRLPPPPEEIAPPASAPPLATPAGTDLLCAVTTDATSTPQVWIGGTVDGLDGAVPTRSVTEDGIPLTDRVLVPAGHIAVVRVTGGPGTDGGPYHLITDLGVRYAVPSAEVLRMLGYPPGQAVDVPAGLVTRVPAGPPLDPAVARQPADVTTSAAAGG